MNLKRRLWIVLAAVAAAACGERAPQPPGGSTIKLVTTTNIVGDLVRTIGEPHVEVESLMGPGIDPHLYKASAGDVRRMTSASAIFYSGLHLEGKMSEVLEKMGERQVRTVAVAECVPHDELIKSEGFSAVHDPHVWFDVALWSKTVACVTDALVELDPDHAEDYRVRAASYVEELLSLDGWVRERISTVEPDRRILVTAHDAFGYFGRAYGFEVRGLLGVSTASEAGTADVQELADFIVARSIPAVFVETSVPPRYVQALKEAVRARGLAVEIGGSLFSDSLGDRGTPAETYAGTVRTNVETIMTALETPADAD